MNIHSCELFICSDEFIVDPCHVCPLLLGLSTEMFQAFAGENKNSLVYGN